MPTASPKRALAYLGAAKQSVQGTGVAPSRFFILKRQDFKPTQKITDFRNGNQRDFANSVKEEFLYKGVFQTYLYANEGGFIIASAMGADSVSGGSDPYQHALTFADDLAYYTYEVMYYDGGIIERVTDCKIAKLLIEAEARGEVMLTVDLMGSSVAVQVSESSVSFSNGAGEGPMRFADGVFSVTGPADGSTMAGQIQKISIEIDQDMSAEPGPGQITPIALFEQGRAVNIKGSALFSSGALHRLVHYGSSTGSAVSSTVATGTLGATFTSQAASPGPERSVALNSPALRWKVSTPKADPDGKTGVLDFEATGYRTGATMPLTATVKNGVSSAYI